MKRYALFEFDIDNYASGGWLDFKGAFDSVEDAEAYLNAPRPRPGESSRSIFLDCFQVVDLQEGVVVSGAATARDLPFPAINQHEEPENETSTK